jgi:hypothetical protein
MPFVADSTRSTPLRVLVYSNDADTRRQVIQALGKRPHPELPPFEYLEVATAPVVIAQMDAGGIDIARPADSASPSS